MGLEIITLFIFSGLLAGFFAGLLGVGGGIVSVPAIFYLLQYAGYSPDVVMPIAIGTSLAITLITSLASSWAHHLKKAIQYPILRLLAPGLFFGSLIGVLLASHLSASILRTIFACMAILFSIYFFFPSLPRYNFGRPNYTLTLFAIGIGCISSLLGIGGGLFALPILLGYQLHMRQAVATSAASTFVSTLIGTFFYFFFHTSSHAIPYTLGYIHIPALISISLASLCTVSWGVHLSHTLNVELVKKVFAGALMATAILMLFK